MLSSNTLDFLKDLSKNNNRDWFKTNKKRYETDVKKPFEELVAAMIDKVTKFDSTIDMPAKKAIFRIYRDTRFSKDKTPYKTYISASFAAKGKKHENDPGYYFHLDTGRLMLGGGAYFIEKNGLLALRKKIQEDSQSFQKILDNKDFVKHYQTIQGEANKRIPKEFKDTYQHFPLIANKQFYFMAELPATTIIQDNFLDIVHDHYKAGYELNCYFREVFEGL